MITTGTSKSKVILSGEHAVVYGKRAVVASVPVTVTAKIGETQLAPKMASNFIQTIFDIFYTAYPQSDQKKAHLLEVISEVPVGCGMGSSAALAHAVFKGLAAYFEVELSREDLLLLVHLSEKAAHGQPSGADATTIVLEQSLIFYKENKNAIFEPLKLAFREKIVFYLINSGVPQETTKDMVGLVAEAMTTNPKRTTQIINEIGQTTEELIAMLQHQRFEPAILSQNQRLLEELGVVGQTAKHMIELIEAAGGYAKITGAGGVARGSGMILATHHNSNVLEKLITTHQWPAMPITL